ncbi:hypothetical protein Leryth_007188 [Lithospermum erythrorhizon]|nr:hypothetical protein Leryth_007188 [Lithospermum erythrorhizon]
MQSGGGGPQKGGGHGRSTAASASASPTSSSSAVSTPQLGFDQNQQRQALQQHLFRRADGNDAMLAYQAGMHGILSGANLTPTTSSVLPQSVKSFDSALQHGSPNIRDDAQNRGQGFDQQSAYMQYALQAAQQKSAFGMASPQQMKLGAFGRDQDVRMGNTKMQELTSMHASNHSTASSSRNSLEHLSRSDNVHQTASDQRSDRKPPSQPTLLGQTVPSMVLAPETQQNIQNMTNNQIAAAQIQAMQAFALERNIDLSNPANANLMAQFIPLMQSRMLPQQKGGESNTRGQSPTLPMSNHQVTSPQLANESLAPGNSSSDVSAQSGPAKARQTVSTSAGSLGVNHGPGADNSWPGKNVPTGPEIMQMRKDKQLNRVSQHAATSSTNAGLPNASPSPSGAISQRPPLGFTKQQLHVLKAQILAFRRIKKNEVLPRELLQSIVPPPFESKMQQSLPSAEAGNQERFVGNTAEDRGRHPESNEKGNQTPNLVSPQNIMREEAPDEKPTTSVIERDVPDTSKEAPAIVSTGGEWQQSTTSGRLDKEVDHGIEKTPKREIAEDLGKAVATPVSVAETAQLNKSVQTSNVAQPKDTSSTRKYHGPLFDFPVFTRKHDAFGSSTTMNNNNNLMLAYDIKDLLMEEDADFLKKEQRQDLARQVQASQKAKREKQLKLIFQWRKKLLEAHWVIRDARTARNRGVAKYHERMLREYSKRKDDRSERMEALKNNDVERYKDLLEQQSNINGDASERYTVLSSFLSQTEEYLQKLGSKITAAKNQQEVDEAANAAAAAARTQGLSEEEVRTAAACAREEVMIRNRFMEMNTPRDSSTVNKYYTLAHAVSETVVRQPSMLRAGILRDYQIVGLQWMLSLYNNKLNGILADEMGLGKTVQVMALIAYLMEYKGNYGPHLIIVPNAVLVNWKSEFLRWLPSASCIFYVGSKDQRSKLFSQEVLAMKFNVLVTTYEFIMFDRSKLSRLDWKYIIIDEAQRMKDRESVLARDLDKYRCQRRLLLTGTPLQNDLKELWSLLNLLLPEVFDNRKAFHDWFAQPFQKEVSIDEGEDDWLETEKKVIVIHRLHQILEPFMLRRRVEDVEGSLPPKVSVVLKCRMSAIQGAIYDWIKSTGTLRVDPEDENRRAQKNPIYQPKTYRMLNNRCMELRKTCNHPLLNYPYFSDFSKDFLIRSCGKLWILDRILIKLQRTGHRVLLFSTMTKLLDILEEYLQWRRLVYRRIDGTTSLEDRESAIVDFNSPDTDCFIFLLSIRAAGRGLNLQTADTVIIYDPDPNPKNEEQAVARAHRIGQKREVKVIYMEAVVDKVSSHQKEDEFRNGGIVDSDDDLAGKDRYVGSIESLIRNNIQQYKIDMADEVINAGRFDQRTTHEERRLTLESLLHDEERYQETLHDVPSLQQVNRMIARSEEEVELFDQMDDEFDWAEDMTRYDQVPEWIRASTDEVNATIAKHSKKPSKNVLFAGNIGVGTTEGGTETEKRRGRPKGKKAPVYTELDDENRDLFEASSDEGNGYEEGDIGEFEEDDFIVGAPSNKDQSDDDGPVSGEGSDNLPASQSTKSNRILEEAGSSGSSSDDRELSQMVSPSESSQKFGSLSALDARPSSRSKRMPDELEEGEIAASPDSHMDVHHSGSWIQERDEGEYEQVAQPKIKRKRSMRVRPRQTADKPEEKVNERSSLRRGDPQSAFPVDREYDFQHRIIHGQPELAEPSGFKNDSMGSSVKNKRNLHLKKTSSTAKVHGAVKSGRGSGIPSANDASECTRDNLESKALNAGRSTSNRTNMPNVVQKKSKNVISRLQRKIEKEGLEIVPLLTDFWKSHMVRPGESLLDVRTINSRIEKLYGGLEELIADVQRMLKNAVQFYGFSHEVKSETEKVHALFFELLKMNFPDSDFSESRYSVSFSRPVSATTGSSSKQVLDAQGKRPKKRSDVEPDPNPPQKPRTRGLVDDVKARNHLIHKEKIGDSYNHEQHLQDDPPPFSHPGDLVVCKKKRKDREKSAVKTGSGSAGPISPVSVGIKSPGSGSVAKNAKLSQHSSQQQGWTSQSPKQANSGGSSLGWANPVKRMRTGAAKRRPSNF